MSSVLIIGANSDVARELARVYAKNGYDLLLCGRDKEELKKQCDDLKLRNRAISAKAYHLDIIDFDSHEKFIDSLEIVPDGVISVVGYLGDQIKAQKDFSEAKRIIDTNYTGVVTILERFAKKFEQRGSGFIVGISSVAGERGRKSNYIYGSAKAGFTTYLSGLRNRLNDFNVHVMSVIPGFIDTKMTKGMDLPEKLTAKPSEVADHIFKAQQKRKNIIYTKPIWRVIMGIIKMIPEWQFKKMSI
jgi:short-subunit dehydrogenase